MKEKLEIEVPFQVQAADYHDFNYMGDLFRLLDDRIVVEEVGYSDGAYVGIVHLGTDEHREFVETLRKTQSEDSA